MSFVGYQFCESCLPSYCSPHCNREKIPTGTLFLNCERFKNNGLQDDCKRERCEKNEACVATQKSSDNRYMRVTASVKHNGLQQDGQRGKCKYKVLK